MIGSDLVPRRSRVCPRAIGPNNLHLCAFVLHLVGRQFAHQRFADSHDLARFARIASSLRFASMIEIRAIQSSLLSQFWKVDSPKIVFLRSESRFVRIGPIRSCMTEEQHLRAQSWAHEKYHCTDKTLQT